MGERDIRDGLRNARVAMEAELSRRAAIATFPGAAAATALMWPYVDHLWAIGWVVLMWAISAIRIPVALLALRAAEADAVTEAQRTMVAGGIAVASFGWGLGVAAGLGLGTAGATMIAVVVLLAISSVGIAYVMDRAMLVAFMIPLAIPPIVFLLVRHEGQDLTMAACYVVYLVIFGNFAGRHHRWIADMLRLNIENRQLLERQARDAGRIRALVDELTVTNARLERSLHDAQAANDAKSRFLAQVSHELRTPLNAILGFAEMMIHTRFDDPVRYQGYAGDIRDSAVLLLNIINDLLDLSRIEAGKTEFRLVTLDLNECISTCMDLIQRTDGAQNLSFEKRLPTGFPQVQLDETFLRQALLNLLSNAVKATPDGGKITVAVEPNGDKRFNLSVADTGVGMPPEMLETVFNPYDGTGNSYVRKEKGTGLGLAIVKRLVEMLRGEVSIASTPGQGTTVRMDLPISFTE